MPPRLSPVPTLYTLGYEKRTQAEFIDLLVHAGIGVLIDVRETAWSHKPGFSKTAFQAALGRVDIHYVHASFAGNPNWLRRTADTHAECLEWYRWYLNQFEEIATGFDALVEPWIARGTRVCLTCFERHPEDCHRSILAADWEQRGPRKVVHLATEGCRRLVAASA